MGRQKRISLTRVPDNNSRTKKRKALELCELCSCEAVVDIKVDRFQFRTIANADIQQRLDCSCLHGSCNNRKGASYLTNVLNINHFFVKNQGKYQLRGINKAYSKIAEDTHLLS